MRCNHLPDGNKICCEFLTYDPEVTVAPVLYDRCWEYVPMYVFDAFRYSIKCIPARIYAQVVGSQPLFVQNEFPAKLSNSYGVKHALSARWGHDLLHDAFAALPRSYRRIAEKR